VAAVTGGTPLNACSKSMKIQYATFLTEFFFFFVQFSLLFFCVQPLKQQINICCFSGWTQPLFSFQNTFNNKKQTDLCNAMCPSKSCQLLHNIRGTTCTTNLEQIKVTEL